MDFLLLVPIGSFTPLLQIISVVLLFCIAALQQYKDAKKSGKMYGTYPPSVLLLLVPIYEEIIFRGLILSGLATFVPGFYAVIVSSILFGLWHIKNLRWDGKKRVLRQVLWAGVILGPLFGFLTIWSGSIWLAVILHYINNIWAPISEKLFKRF
jgi:membrane protease YdiL (CAAX protease family)